MEKLQKRNLALVIALATVFIIAAGIAVYYLIGTLKTNEAIAAIDATEFSSVAAEKGEQYKQKGEPLTADITESLEGNVYNTPLGFPIISYSDNWTGRKLIEIYDELLENKHGDEIRYITKIELFSDEAEYSDDFNAAGDISGADIDPNVYVDVRGLIPAKLRYDTDPVVSEISLYYMDDYDAAADVAAVLAHEYGHHFTMYYFMQDENAIKDSAYYTLRGVEDFDHEVFFYTAQSYYDNYMWDIYEIAANDYVQLMGGPNTKQIAEYMDGYDLLQAGEKTYKLDIKWEYKNAFPQENIFIPLADEVSGLRDYFYGFIKLENEYDAPLEIFDFNLQIERKSSYGHRYYNITWTMASTDPGAIYTLVCYDSDGNLYMPVRTVYGDEEPIARVGSPVIRKGNWIYWWTDGIPDEARIFKLYLLLPDGRMLSSEPFYVDF